jgi:hypothetical protein
MKLKKSGERFMKIKYACFVITYCIVILYVSLNAMEKAVICVPIADLLGEPMHKIYPGQLVTNSYDNLPVCDKTNTRYACPRIHQLVYNDIVDIVETKNDETHIQISQLFYTKLSSLDPQTTYWTQSKNLRLLKDITQDISHIPQPLSFKENNKKSTSNNQHIITLKEPHYDSTTQLTFSAGTRFVCSQKPTQHRKKLKVFIIDYHNNKEHCITIPTDKCIFLCNSNPNQHIKNFVDLLKSWANQNNSFIPYVWGGTSFTSTINTPFKVITKETGNHSYSYYEYENEKTKPKSGFDCSGLISRAAQICSIPYFYKNTITIRQHLQPLTPEDVLINGDLILVKGHVMAISDIEKNLLIEARSYGSGYGKVQEIALNNVFDAIETYTDLCNAFFNNKELKRKDKWGKIQDTYQDWKILKIMSVYKDNGT